MIFYDFECFKYDWLVVMIDLFDQSETVIINDAAALEKFYTQHKQNIFVGFNSRNYDQYILKGILCGLDPKEINDFIIVKGRKGWEFSNLLREVPLINFDIMPPFLGLKTLEGFMGNNIKETSVPFDIDRKLTDEEIEETVKYCRHDVEQSIEVFFRKKEEFDSHLGLIKAFDLPLTYLNKTKAQLSAIILNCTKQKHDDEFDLIIPDTLKLKKYTEVLRWYQNPLNYKYKDAKLEIMVAGVLHTFAWGGLHGAIPKYSGEGLFLNVDVASYYPALMIEYGFGSRNMSNPDKYREIRDLRLKYKKEKNPMQAPLKIVLNSTYGAMKDKYNALYDPRQANNVCVGGQLLLLDLIEKLEGHCELIQSNTDGLIIKIPDTDEAFNTIDDICFEWEQRTRMTLEFDTYSRIYQKDVNNYLIVDDEGNYKSKGAYVKKPAPLDNDLPIVKTAVLEYFLHGTRPEDTISNCDELIQFQKIVKISGKYAHALYNPKVHEEKVRDENGKSKKVNVFEGGHIQSDKTFRVFADKREGMGGLFKVKGDGSNPQKFADTPEHANIWNQEVKGVKVPVWLDREWYITMAEKRLKDFGVKL